MNAEKIIQDILDEVFGEHYSDALDIAMNKLDEAKTAELIKNYGIGLALKDTGDITMTVKVSEKDEIRTFNVSGKVVLDNQVYSKKMVADAIDADVPLNDAEDIPLEEDNTGVFD